MNNELNEIINSLYDLLYDFESKSLDKKVQLIILNYKTYQKISAYDRMEKYINFKGKTIIGIPYIIKCDSEIDIQVK